VSGAVAADARQKFPPQIPYIMASEGAERFSFYGMRNILVIYMVQYLLVSASDSKASYHYFVMANYLMPLVGGWLADRFLGRWKAEMEAEANIEQVFGRLDTLAVNNLLSPSRKNFNLNKNYFFNGRHLPVQNVNITVAGDYARTLNWLGLVESAFPLARVELISYTNSGNSLSLNSQFVFPQSFLPE